jgi:Zn-dependent peptidase ImmA (M78 family)
MIADRYKKIIGEYAAGIIKAKARTMTRHYKTANPFALAVLSGISVQRIKLPKGTKGIRGFAQDGRIFLSDRLHPAQRRLTMAHELGHQVLGHLKRPGDVGYMECSAELFCYYLTGEVNPR